MTKITKGKEMVKAFEEMKNPKELAEAMSDFVNSFTYDQQGFIDGMKEASVELQVEYTLICLAWIKKLNYLKSVNWYDGRNEYSINVGVEIHSLLKDELNSLLDGYNGQMDEMDYKYEAGKETPVDFKWIFVEKISRSHRTLQQSFSGIVFTWLSELENLNLREDLTKMSKTINEKLEYRFFRTPLI